MYRFLKYAIAIGLSLGAVPCYAEDAIVCADQNQILVCNLSLHDYMNKTSDLMTNGWENQLDIQLDLINTEDKIVKTSHLHASQRCYIDPFESPCLVLWRGAKSWRTYRDVSTFIKSLSNLSIHAMKLNGVEPDNYRVRATIIVTEGSEKQSDIVKKWFRQSGNAGLRLGESSLIGSFISVFAPVIQEAPGYHLVLETTEFYIDILFDLHGESEINR